MANNSKTKFPGFPASLEKSYWQFPTIINGYVYSLSGAEFKVLWYILRHTFGWQKSSDKLSITQICSGVKKKDKTYLDKGTGLSRKWVMNTLTSLEKKGFIYMDKSSGKTTKISPNITGELNTPLPVEQNTPVAGVENTPTIDTFTKDITKEEHYTKKYNGKDATKYLQYKILISYLKEKRGISSLDGTVAQNNKYIFHLLKHRADNNVELVQKAIDRCNYKSFQKIYYNWNDIMTERTIKI